MTRRVCLTAVTLLLFALSACSGIDCPLDNVVSMKCGLYSAEDETSLRLSDTLTVRAGGIKDTVLLNRAQGISDFLVPLRQGVTTDTLLFCFSNAERQSATDTVYVTHTNQPHFESIDCPLAVFHTVQSVRWTSHHLSAMPLTIDSIAIVRQLVDYEDVENLKIYLRSTTQLH